ncbi:MAG: general secretion pathway protein GspF [Gammaproteobacteria bacterium]|nr:general secretion pathway protein GspF [Gammaproteobacteria bacterium]MDH5239686.1 general secretion pathway protein GspF [Gammaproteobacteria bacterium]MDH5260958.1 general secretion pathway protein GspF [Gammaproteobacteria bacterium]MDH5621640.1 general secretion pathway protein GspF [Gammaproteobacteria bacterium]
MTKRRNARHWDTPQLHGDHPRPVTRRQFVAQGFMSGAAYTVGAGSLGMLSTNAMAALSGDIDDMRLNICRITDGAGKIPFICFDLAGGANIAGSNVLIGQSGGQSDFLGTQGYEKMGLPGDMVPGLNDANNQPFANFDLGLGFHLDSAFRRGILASITPGTELNINGAVIPARSDNDTGNNPHNPMYGIAMAGAKGSILTLTGSENTDSGGNSMLPAVLYNPLLRPTKVDRPSDVVNLVDTGDLVGILSKADATAVMESIYRLSDQKMNAVNTQLPTDAAIKEAVRCGYVKAAHIAETFGGVPIDPLLDPDIVASDGSAIFTTAEFTDGSQNAREFQKTASVMKLVMNGFAGAGCIEMGGYDYHGGARAEGEVKDFRAGRCMGAVLEYAARLGKPVMMYVFSDGSLSSNGVIDNSTNGRGKGEWTSDNSSTAAGFFLVYNPTKRPVLLGGTPDQQALHQQIGAMDAGGSVMRGATPMANNVNLLANSVILNYMALHGEQGNFEFLFDPINRVNRWSHGLGSNLDTYTAFEPIVNGTIANPIP